MLLDAIFHILVINSGLRSIRSQGDPPTELALVDQIFETLRIAGWLEYNETDQIRSESQDLAFVTV